MSQCPTLKTANAVWDLLCQIKRADSEAFNQLKYFFWASQYIFTSPPRGGGGRGGGDIVTWEDGKGNIFPPPAHHNVVQIWHVKLLAGSECLKTNPI